MSAHTLDWIRRAGVLRVGVSRGIPGLSEPVGNDYAGLDADFARSVAIAIGVAEVDWVPLDPAQRIDAVLNGRADLGCCNLSWTLPRSMEVLFAGVLCHDGEGLLVRSSEIDSSSSLNGRAVVVQSGTTSEANLGRWHDRGGPKVQVLTGTTPEDALAIYQSGQASAYVLDRTALAGIRSRLPEPEKHRLLPDVLSPEPMAPYTAPSSLDLWRVVQATLGLLVSASGATPEDGTPIGLDLTSVDRLGDRIGLDDRWATRVIRNTGGYDYIFDRNLGATSPLGLDPGANRPVLSGGALIAPALH